MKKVIVTEKPSVARDYAKILGVHGNGQGCIEDDEWIITWCVGHLIEMCYPHVYDPELKKWKLELLPFLPEEYLYEVIPGVKDQFNVIKKIYHRKDISCIYYAGDSAREGIYIQDLVRKKAGTKAGVKELVVWIDSQTKEEVLKGIRQAKPISEYKNLIDSGYMRAIEDYAIGINFSRMMSIKYGGLLMTATAAKKYTPIAVGRVMTCVLGMIVERDREIRNFTPTQFYKPVCKIQGSAGEVLAKWKKNPKSDYPDQAKLYDESGFKTQADAEEFIGRLPDTVKISRITRKKENKYAPMLYNLAELQADCSKRLKISPEETLTAAQSLYEKKLTTYPRTDARVLSTAVAGEISGNIRGLSELADYNEVCNKILSSGSVKKISSTRYVDDSKISDHYALIPTGEIDGMEDLDLIGIELKVYEMIVKRFLSIFMPAAVYEKVSLLADAEGQSFSTQVSVLSEPGWYEVAGIPKDDGKKAELAKVIGGVCEGESYAAEYSVEQGETKPPARFTSGSIILAMENAGNLIEDEELRAQIKGSGIGTSATRAATITKLVKNEYIILNKKTQVLTPAPLGEMVYEVVKQNVPALLSPKMTASWEKGLEGVAQGSVAAQEYRNKMESYVRKECAYMKDNDFTENLTEKVRPFAKYDNFKNGNWTPTPGAKKQYLKKSDIECWLNVPFEQKDAARELGARFDSKNKAWYVPKGTDRTPFAAWDVGDKPPVREGAKVSGSVYWLTVPYDDKDEVRALGARFDFKDKKKWYVPEGVDVSLFEKWNPSDKPPAKKTSDSGTSGTGSACWLNVPYEDKDEAKALGARFSMKRKKWYVPAGEDTAAFAKWQD